MRRFGDFITHTPVLYVIPFLQCFLNSFMGTVFMLLRIIECELVFPASPVITFSFTFAHVPSFLYSGTVPTQYVNVGTMRIYCIYGHFDTGTEVVVILAQLP